MRAVRRLWQSIDAFERPSAELVEATNLCFAECRELASALDPLRAQTISQMHTTVNLTWTRLLRVAHQFTVSYQGL
jgi:DNA repair ATPase RecN